MSLTERINQAITTCLTAEEQTDRKVEFERWRECRAVLMAARDEITRLEVYERMQTAAGQGAARPTLHLKAAANG